MLDLSFNSYFKNESIFLKSKVYKYGIGTEKNYDKAIDLLNLIIDSNSNETDKDFLVYEKDLKEKSIKELEIIKSLKSGYAIENEIIKSLPLELPVFLNGKAQIICLFHGIA